MREWLSLLIIVLVILRLVVNILDSHVGGTLVLSAVLVVVWYLWSTGQLPLPSQPVPLESKTVAINLAWSHL